LQAAPALKPVAPDPEGRTPRESGTILIAVQVGHTGSLLPEKSAFFLHGVIMSVEVSKSAVIFSGADGVRLFRLATIVRGMKLEMVGMRLTAKAPSCFTIARREFGLKGNKTKILADMTAIYEAAKAGA